jgi:pyruvate dehydrogenase E2 component (dihydrolipoamide acetyltransferase)
VEGTVTALHIKVGDPLSTGDPIVTVQSTSVAEAKPKSEDAPTAKQADTGPGLSPRSQGRSRTPENPRVAAETPSPQAVQPPPPPDLSQIIVPAAPTARRFAREIGVDITMVEGTGPGGRISIDDVKGTAKRALNRIDPTPRGGPSPELPAFETWGPVRRQPMTKIRKVTAKNLARAWITVPQVTNHDLADITTLEEARKIYRPRVEAAGGRLTITAIIVKIIASGLKKYPKLGASIDPDREEIVFKDFVHIGVAVDTERGLLVPVIRDADRKNITEISVELDDLARRARDRKLTPDEMRGAVFSISNLGGIGGTGFSPIVNWPEVAILGVSRGSFEPRWNGSEFVPRLMLPLSLSYDHRLVDGAEAARFLRWVAEALEQPLLLALEG